MNLIICVTNLQILIAERIIDLYPNESFYGLLYITKGNSKNEYYAKRLKQKCSKFEIIYVEDLQGGFLKSRYANLRLLTKSYFLPKIKRIFIASLDLSDIHLYLHKLSTAEVITFDDGSLNLNPKAFQDLMKLGRGGRIIEFLSYFFSIPTWETLFNRKCKHYTIYKAENVMGNGIFIDLFSNQFQCTGDFEIKETKRIMLGQHIYGMSDEDSKKNIKATELVLQKYSIDGYFPHPREPYKLSNISYIKSPYIFEDYLLQEMKKHPDTKFEVYSFCSSVLLNLAGVKSPQLSMTAIRPNSLPKNLQANYDIFITLGISVEQLDY